MASLEISYWSGQGALQHGNIPGKVISSESLSITGTSAQSGAIPAAADLVSIVANGAAARFLIAANPTAAASSPYLGSGERMWVPADGGFKIAGITA